jgi:hypothetical protein
MNREEAIAWFRARGVDASKRDWALGATIFIPASPPRQDREGDIIAFDRVFYLYPWTNGSWRLLKFEDRESETTYPDLESAAQAALDALAEPGKLKPRD